MDDVLFSSLRSLGLSDCEPHELDQHRLEVGALLKDGSTICYSTPAQRGLLQMMLHGTDHVVAVTARSVDAYSRSVLTSAFSKAVCSNGAVILDAEGNRDQAWADVIRDRLAASQPLMSEFIEGQSKWAEHNNLRHWLVQEEGLGPIYYCAKSNLGNADHLKACVSKLHNSPSAWVGTTHLNGNNLALLPRGLSKRAAVAYLLEVERHLDPELTTFGFGDSATDWSFMGLCDFAVSPRSSQLSGLITSAIREYLQT